MVGDRQPVIEAEPHEEKRPAAVVDPELAREGRLSWRLSLLDLEGRPAGGATTLEHLREQLCPWEAASARELIARKRLQPVAVSALVEPARRRLAELPLDDVEELWLLTLATGERLWGILQGSVFAPVWWTSPGEDLRARRRRARD
jgi:hypothetical protein